MLAHLHLTPLLRMLALLRNARNAVTEPGASVQPGLCVTHSASRDVVPLDFQFSKKRMAVDSLILRSSVLA